MTDYHYPKSHQYFFSDIDMKKIFDLYQVKNLQDLKLKLNADWSPIQKLDSKQEREYLSNLKLRLDCWKIIKELFPEKTLTEIVSLVTGKEILPMPSVDLIEKSKNHCNRCNHEHDSTTGVCKDRMCMCGLR